MRISFRYTNPIFATIVSLPFDILSSCIWPFPTLVFPRNRYYLLWRNSALGQILCDEKPWLTSVPWVIFLASCPLCWQSCHHKSTRSLNHQLCFDVAHRSLGLRLCIDLTHITLFHRNTHSISLYIDFPTRLFLCSATLKIYIFSCLSARNTVLNDSDIGESAASFRIKFSNELV